MQCADRVPGSGNRDAHSLPVEMQNGVTTLKNSLAVSYKVKYMLTI